MNIVDLSVLAHAYAATAEEMGVNLYQSAHSTIVREVRDLATAILDTEGETVAIANYIPQLVNAMEPAAEVLRREYDFRDLAPGEALVTNDPFNGGQHVNDILLFTPIHVDGSVVAIACANVHHLDVGGGAPASNARATEIFQEGLVIPPMKIELGDDWERTTFGRMLRANIRVPETTTADFHAQISACRTGESRIQELARRYGADALLEFHREVQAYSEHKMRAAIERVPDGEYHASAEMEDDGTGRGGPFRVVVTLRVSGSDIAVDFDGTDDQASGFINVPWGSTVASTRTTILSLLRQGHRLVNGGCFRPISVSAPYGTLVNPRHPAATRARTSTCYKIFDCINVALADAAPELVMAPGFDCQTGISFSRRADGRVRVLSEVLGAGLGGMQGQDGADGMIMHLTNGFNTPVECVEGEFPFLRVERYGLVADTGGDGRWRGGLGMERVYRLLQSNVVFGLHSDRHRTGAPGLFGGEPARPGACELLRDGELVPLGSKVLHELAAGDVLRVASGGGGGYGPAREREPGARRRDAVEARMTRLEPRTNGASPGRDLGDRTLVGAHGAAPTAGEQPAEPAEAEVQRHA